MAAALFDLDGVLIDTEGLYSEFWAETGRAFGVPDPDFADKIKGTTLDQILNNNFPIETHPAVFDRLIAFEETMEYRVYPGVIPFLEELKARGIPAAIVTSSGSKKMERLWRQHPRFRSYFDAVITDADVTRSKPDPEPYLVGAKRVGCKIENCYVFEDSMNGVKSGQASGAKVIGVSTTNPAEALAPYSTIVIPSLAGFSVERMLEV